MAKNNLRINRIKILYLTGFIISVLAVALDITEFIRIEAIPYIQKCAWGDGGAHHPDGCIACPQAPTPSHLCIKCFWDKKDKMNASHHSDCDFLERILE